MKNHNPTKWKQIIDYHHTVYQLLLVLKYKYLLYNHFFYGTTKISYEVNVVCMFV